MGLFADAWLLLGGQRRTPVWLACRRQVWEPAESGCPMGSEAAHDQAFVIRLWLERREFVGMPAHWRGVIEHVPSGERRYLRDLADVAAFIAPYLVGWALDASAADR